MLIFKIVHKKDFPGAIQAESQVEAADRWKALLLFRMTHGKQMEVLKVRQLAEPMPEFAERGPNV